MTDVILFHHVQGLTAGVAAFADQLRGAGHQVTTPDLFDGANFGTIEEGIAHAENLGFEAILAAAASAAEALSERVVYCGFSLGALAAHKLAQTRPGALGALLYHHGDVPITTFGDSWPDGVDLQIHVAEEDEFCEIEVVREFVANAGAHADAELFLYPGSTHLFTDVSLAGYDLESAALVVQRTLRFLRTHS
jgi:dienelactone hydrolase